MVNAMSKINIPPAALEAGARAIREFYSDEPIAICDGAAYKAARAAFEAMVEAWEGMQVRLNYFQPTEEIILPLPTQETRDADSK